ncbi:hypothetical protein ACOMHN_033337 [Nucella lapillus]
MAVPNSHESFEQANEDDVEKKIDDELMITSNVSHTGLLLAERGTSGQNEENSVASGQNEENSVASGQNKENSVASGQNEENSVASGQNEENSVAVSSPLGLNPTGSAEVLLEILTTVKHQAESIKSLQESNETVLLELRDLRNFITREIRQIDSHLSMLLQESGKSDVRSSENSTTKPHEINTQAVNVYDKSHFKLFETTEKTRKDKPTPPIKSLDDLAQSRRAEVVSFLDNDSAKGSYLLAFTGGETKSDYEGESTSSFSAEQGSEQSLETPPPSSKKEAIPSDLHPGGTTKEKAKVDLAENLASNIPENRHSRNRNRIPGHTLTIGSSGDSESQRLHEALERARAPVANPPPKARSYDTVLCLDTSESMLRGGAHQQMIQVATDFINGVEDMTSEVEENIGLVTFGGRANIVQHLTNDFSLIREEMDKIEFAGSSPFFEAMVVCLGAFDGKGGTVSLSGEYDVHPRIIFITDGHITEGSDDPFDRVTDASNTRANFSRLMMDLNSKKDSSMPHPIVFVPVGSRADHMFLKSMAELNDGELIEPEKLVSACNYFKIQETIGKVIVCLQNKKTEDISEHAIRNVIQALVLNMTSEETSKVIDAVCREMKNPTNWNSRSDPLAFDEVFEDKESVAEGERLPLGTRVVRGPDWSWGDQDKNGPGTVIQHEEKKHGFTWVLWDGGNKNRYPYGSEMGHHIWKTDEHPYLRTGGESFKIGMTVKKGPQWNNSKLKYDREIGVIIRVSRGERKLKVRWANGVIGACPDYSVECSDPFEQDTANVRHETQDTHRLEPVTEEEEEEGDNSGNIAVWRWKDDWGNWRLYSRPETERIEAAYQRKKQGTCVIIRGSKQFRILFQRNAEKDVEKHTERDIQRNRMQREELQSLELAEELMFKG